MTVIDPSRVRDALLAGGVIPAHPLALADDGTVDRAAQMALTRYYLDAGSAGLAVGVHTTQFAIREHGLYRPILELVARTARDWPSRPAVLVAGVVGDTDQAVREAETAASCGYHATLLNVAAVAHLDVDGIVEHCRRVAEVLPVLGFALLPECGGVHLPYEFWRSLASLDGVVGIKLASFNRYRTLEIIRAVVDARAEERLALFTGNDDHILLDLLAGFDVTRDDGAIVRVRLRGGLLGQWSVWTQRAVEMQAAAAVSWEHDGCGRDLLAMDARLTDANCAVYDALNDFRGSIAGCLEVLRRQGLVRSARVLPGVPGMSPGQSRQLDRVLRAHPDLQDDDFVARNLDRWLGADGGVDSLTASERT